MHVYPPTLFIQTEFLSDFVVEKNLISSFSSCMKVSSASFYSIPKFKDATECRKVEERFKNINLPTLINILNDTNIKSVRR